MPPTRSSSQSCKFGQLQVLLGPNAPDALVAIGTQKLWWPNRDKMLARLLKRDGHNVILVDIGRIRQLAIDSAKVRSSL